jgi:hypothetical protein
MTNTMGDQGTVCVLTALAVGFCLLTRQIASPYDDRLATGVAGRSDLLQKCAQQCSEIAGRFGPEALQAPPPDCVIGEDWQSGPGFQRRTGHGRSVREGVRPEFQPSAPGVASSP